MASRPSIGSGPSSGSRLPTLSTPHRLGTPPTPTASGIPTPTHRRPRSSLGPANSAPPPADTDAMDHLHEALRRRPPSSMRKLLDDADGGGDPDTPTHSTFPSSSLAPPTGSAAPRTPIARSRTPNGPAPGNRLGLGAPVTPSTSRSSSRPSIGVGRPSIGGASGTSGVFTPRRISMASSTTSTTPYRRPESRLGGGTDSAGGGKFAPLVRDKVRMQGMGMEGTLRFLGATQFKEGVWAGVELEGGFKGMGKNDGSVEGIEYFSCPPKCGVFILAARLSAPTATAQPSRPASVASHISHASQSSLSGRMTPSNDRLRPATATPGKARTFSTSQRSTPARSIGYGMDAPDLPEETQQRPQRTLLGISTSTNTTPGKITAGSRASKYVGMTAKQLQSAREGTLGASVRGPPAATGLDKSTATTPKASRISMGMGISTPGPALRARPSIGGNMMTPKAKPRGSTAQGLSYGGGNSGERENMPPPPSPGKVRAAAAQQANTANLEALVKDLQSRNSELEEELTAALQASAEVDADDSAANLETLRNEIEAAQLEVDELRHHLAQVQEDARQATDLSEELIAKCATLEEEAKVDKDLAGKLRLEKEEVDAGLEAKRGEVKVLEGKLGELEVELGEAEGNVEELRAAGQATISLYEQKLSDQETRAYELEDRIRVLEDKLTKSESDRIRLSALPSSSSTNTDPTSLSPSLASAAEIDNETLQNQITHLQSKIGVLEDHLEEARTALESEAEAWKSRLDKARNGEKEKAEMVRGLQEELGVMQSQAKGAKGRISELEGALMEVRGALEGARGEIEGLRGEAAEAATLRTALQKATLTEAALAERTTEVDELRARMARFDEMRKDCERFEAQVAALQAELASLERRSPRPDPNLPLPPRTSSIPALHPLAIDQDDGHHRRPRLSTGSQEGDEQKMHGYHHVIKELTRDNQGLTERVKGLENELEGLKEEVRLMEDLNANGGGAEGAEEWKVKEERYKGLIKELEGELSELETLVESKIYQQDDLEHQISELQRDLRVAHSSTATNLSRQQQHISIPPSGTNTGTAPLRTPTRASSLSASTKAVPTRSPSALSSSGDRSSSTGSIHTAEEYPSPDGTGEAGSGHAGVRCELCEGPHDLDACPVFAGNLDALPVQTATGGATRGVRCADCDSTDHDTADCPMADDVF